MLISERRQAIVDWVNAEEYISTEELTQRLHISQMTLWRDLKRLEEQGLIRRIWGGAACVEAREPLPVQTGFEITPGVFDPRKVAIGRYVAQNLIQPGESITLEGGTTVASMIPYLDQPNLTILTNGLNALTLAHACMLKGPILCCGGILNQETRTFFGPQAERFFADFRVQTAFLSAAGLTLDAEFTDPSPFYVQLKQVMHRHAARTVMLIDSGKYGIRTLTRVMSLQDVDIVVTNSDAPPEMVTGLQECGIEVHLAKQ